MWADVRKTLAGGILSFVVIGFFSAIAGMFLEVQTLKANDSKFEHTYELIQKRLERIENKNDKIIEKIMEM